METKVPCSFLLPCAMISFFCYMNPFLSKKGQCGIFMFWASQSHLRWHFSSQQKCFERGSEAACIILVIQGYSDQKHLHQPICTGEVKSLCILFPEFSFLFHTEQLRNSILRKTILTHTQSQKEFLVFLQRMQSFFSFFVFYFFVLVGIAFLHAPEGLYTSCWQHTALGFGSHCWVCASRVITGKGTEEGATFRSLWY